MVDTDSAYGGRHVLNVLSSIVVHVEKITARRFNSRQLIKKRKTAHKISAVIVIMDIEKGWVLVDDINVAEVLKIWFALRVSISAAQKLVEGEIDVLVFSPTLRKAPEEKVGVERPCHSQ
jgi:hypothetical protein